MAEPFDRKNSEGYVDTTPYEAVKRLSHEQQEFSIETPTLRLTIRAFHFFPCSYTDAKFLFALAAKYCTAEEKRAMLSYLYEHQKYMKKLENLETLIKNITLFKSLMRKGDK